MDISLKIVAEHLTYLDITEAIPIVLSLKWYYDQKNNSCVLWISKLC